MSERMTVGTLRNLLKRYPDYFGELSDTLIFSDASTELTEGAVAAARSFMDALQEEPNQPIDRTLASALKTRELESNSGQQAYYAQVLIDALANAGYISGEEEDEDDE